jgi:hypothetical protein
LGGAQQETAAGMLSAAEPLRGARWLSRRRSTPADRRPLHHDEARALQGVDKAPRHDPSHHLGSVVLPPAAVEAQRERESVGKFASSPLQDFPCFASLI